MIGGVGRFWIGVALAYAGTITAVAGWINNAWWGWSGVAALAAGAALITVEIVLTYRGWVRDQN